MTPEPLMLTADQGAALLDVHHGTLIKTARKGKVPGFRQVGNRLLFNRRLFLQWLGEEVPRGFSGLPAYCRGFASLLLNCGVELHVIQVLLGHASIATTQLYAKTSTRSVGYSNFGACWHHADWQVASG
jgi:integrase